MTYVTGIFLLALPTGLVVAANLLMMARPARLATWVVVLATWAIACWLWVDYARQQDDVGLMVSGIAAFAVTASALGATLAAIVAKWQRRR